MENTIILLEPKERGLSAWRIEEALFDWGKMYYLTNGYSTTTKESFLLTLQEDGGDYWNLKNADIFLSLDFGERINGVSYYNF